MTTIGQFDVRVPFSSVPSSIRVRLVLGHRAHPAFHSLVLSAFDDLHAQPAAALECKPGQRPRAAAPTPPARRSLLTITSRAPTMPGLSRSKKWPCTVIDAVAGDLAVGEHAGLAHHQLGPFAQVDGAVLEQAVDLDPRARPRTPASRCAARRRGRSSDATPARSPPPARRRPVSSAGISPLLMRPAAVAGGAGVQPRHHARRPAARRCRSGPRPWRRSACCRRAARPPASRGARRRRRGRRPSGRRRRDPPWSAARRRASRCVSFAPASTALGEQRAARSRPRSAWRRAGWRC